MNRQQRRRLRKHKAPIKEAQGADSGEHKTGGSTREEGEAGGVDSKGGRTRRQLKGAHGKREKLKTLTHRRKHKALDTKGAQGA